jgi:hypothetical protein
MRRSIAIGSLFALFACAYFTLDALPRSAASVLRGGIEFVARAGEFAQIDRPVS